MVCKVTASKSHYPKDVPFEVPKGWVWSTLGAISSYGLCPSIQVEQINENAWVLELEDIEKDTGKLISKKTKKDRTANGIRHSFERGQVLYSKLRTYLNKVLLADHDGFCSTEIMPISFYGGILAEYMVIVLASPYFLDYTTSCGYGVKMPRLGTNDAIKSAIPIPPIEEQKRIVRHVNHCLESVEIISRLDNALLIDINIATHQILDLGIHGKLVPQNPSDEPAIELLRRINPAFQPSHNLHYEGRIPTGWQVCRIKDLFMVTMGQSPDGISLNHKEGIEFHQGKICFTDKYLSESGIFTSNPTKFAEPNSLLCCVRAPVGLFNITTRQICIGRGLCSLSPLDEAVDIEYWYYALSNLTEYYERMATGSTFKAISGDIIRNTVIAVPPKMEQKRILEKISRFLSILKEVSDTI